ncbi:DNA cytosine methyltransferase [Arcobacter vandammei]|uniref:DNA cytosine methyltransferase n=1 Tax=Arcobacter vandammei TaxID=2782243 RepID=UPI001D18AF31|nr:DNA cytosine methyltransferase [Arcobacter vandammei]
MSSINGVSLFSNVGIAETFIKNHNINIVVANELLERRAEFYKHNHPNTKIVQGDITKNSVFEEILKEAKEKNCQFLIATPPCQGMSVAGKMQENDPRNSLIKYAVKMIKELEPKYIIIENVIGVLKASILVNGEKIKIVDFLKNELKGYFINYKIVDVANYGTPQTRKRAIFLISKNRLWEFPKEQKTITVREAIGHLPALESGENSHIPYHYAKEHNPRHILWLKHTPTGKTALNNEVYFPKKEDGTRIKGFQTTYKRIEWDKPAPTITMANGSVSSQNNVHPGRLKEDGTYSDARVLSLKEIFILTGLPEDWAPPAWASENLIREVIGEAIPPKLIDEILRTIPKD